MRAGFIGLGNMGRPIARNLLRAGHELVVHNRTESRSAELAAAGARVAATVAEACGPGLVVTMLADDRATEETAYGEGRILDALPPGGVHVSLSTISTALSRRLAEDHQSKGQSFVAAPVFGRPDAAEVADLVVVAAGPVEALERSRPLLEAMGRRLFIVGADAPSANTVKLAGNFMIASVVETLGEAFALVRKSGIDPGFFLEVINGSLMQSPVYENYGKIILQEKFEPPVFRMRLGLKDIRLILGAGESSAVPLPSASLIRDHMLAAIARGKDEMDWSAVAKVIAENAGL